MSQILRVDNLSKSYEDFNLKQISFVLEKGSITGFIGQNGAGKSTTMKLIMGLIKADKGEILFSGQRIGYLGMNKDFYPDAKLKTLSKFIAGAYQSCWNEDKYNHYMFKVFHLSDNKKMKELSTGMKMKYLLALELSKCPDLLLLDEPTSGLDPVVRDEVLEILKELADKEKLTVFFSSHITEDIDKIANHVIYIRNGKIEKYAVKKHGYYIIDKMQLNENMELHYEKVTLDELLLSNKEEKEC